MSSIPKIGEFEDLATFSFSKNYRDLKSEYFLEKLHKTLLLFFYTFKKENSNLKLFKHFIVSPQNGQTGF